MNKPAYSIPPLYLWILRKLTVYEELFAITRDFEIEYAGIRQGRSRLSAYLWLLWNTLLIVFHYFWLSTKWSVVMIRNYIKITFRNIKRHKGYSFINIAGLSMGMACCLLILLWVQDETGFEKFHDNADRIYRINIIDNLSSQSIYAGITPPAAGPYLKDNYPEVENATRILGTGLWKLQRGGQTFTEYGWFVDPSFFEIFTFPFVKGQSDASLSDPLSMVLPKGMAHKIFGNEDPVGKSLTVNDKYAITVTGVIENAPKNSMFADMNFLVPTELSRRSGVNLEAWGSIMYSTYVRLRKDADAAELNKKISSIYKEQYPQLDKVTLYLQPLLDIHLHSENIVVGMGGGGNIRYVYIFSALAVFILLLACINFMNLSTARSEKKAREVGVRKVVGAVKSDLVMQFFGESLFLTVLALSIALALVFLFLPAFSSMTAKSLALGDMDLSFILGIGFVTLFTGLISGSYPAFFLSSFQPVKVLRSAAGKASSGGSKHLRRVLVVFQFSISVILLVCTFTVMAQMSFIKNRDLGYDKEQVIYLRLRGEIYSNYSSFKDELLRNPEIVSVSLISDLPTNIVNVNVGFDWEGKDPEDPGRLNVLYVDDSFLKTFTMSMVKGRAFSEDFPTDEFNFILNEAALKKTGFSSPIGKKFSLDKRQGEIIGIVKNFHFRSLHSEISPLVLMIVPSEYNFICIKTDSEKQALPGTIDFIQGTWESFAPDYDFDYGFLDEQFDSMYRSEQRLKKIFHSFTSLAIFISCLGLLGLAAFLAERRTKEIGIRKILGASRRSIIKLLSGEFALLLIISNVLAWPFAYYSMSKWLQSFVYRIQVSVWTFILSGLLASSIAFLTVSIQAVRTSNTNPVESLRNE